MGQIDPDASRVFSLKAPASDGSDGSGAQPDVQAGSCMFGKNKKHKTKTQTKTKPAVSWDWVGCMYNNL